MKKILFNTLFIISAFTLIALTGCMRHHGFDQIDTTPPSAPTGVYAINGDNRVDIYWDSNPERDVAGYNVYYSDSYYGQYALLGSTTSTHYTDYGVHNGTTYYYAVSAYDYDGNDSKLSRNDVNATPRPEGFNVNIFDYHNYPNTSGFSFFNYDVVPFDDKTCDFYFDVDNGTPYIDVNTDTDIQDVGPTIDIYDISNAPTSGWSPAHSSIATVGHTYVIWTYDGYYAKIRVSNITNNRLVFDWAFQTAKGNTALKVTGSTTQRTSGNRNFLKRNY